MKHATLIEATFLTLHFFALCEIFRRSREHGPSGPMVNTLMVKRNGHIVTLDILVAGIILGF